MSDLPIREMVLYKHGVGYFVRAGEFTGETITLNFLTDDINDVLKSLTVLDRAGGKVLGVNYQTANAVNIRNVNSSINLSEMNSQLDLVRDLRGRMITCTIETDTTQREITGRVIGIEKMEKGQIPHRLVIQTADEQVHFLDLATLETLAIHDDKSRQDLAWFLDSSLNSRQRQLVTVRLTPGDHNLMMSYVAPSPTWRVSYRFVAESNEENTSGKGLLQGWGIFDNNFNEDLTDVRVTFVAGQPISFIYDLYSANIPARPVVEDEARVLADTIEFGSITAASTVRGSLPLPTGQPRQQTKMARGGEGLRSFRAEEYDEHAFSDNVSMEDVAQSVDIEASGESRGEFFQYSVTNPVSVKRGQSSLIPILGTEVEYTKELLYNSVKLPDHPVLAVRFDNTSGLILERGPITIVENSDYKGEAILTFTKADETVFLAYAVELGVHVTPHHITSHQTAHLNIKNGYIVLDNYEIRQCTYLIENTTAQPIALTIEENLSSNQTDYELFETPEPDLQTNKERRWSLAIDAQAQHRFVRKERKRLARQTLVRNLNYKQLDHYLKNRWLDEEAYQALYTILAQLEHVQQLGVDLQAINAERTKLYEAQKQIRENLAPLQSDSDQEAKLRERMLNKLSQTQDELDELERREVELKQEIERINDAVDRAIQSLG